MGRGECRAEVFARPLPGADVATASGRLVALRVPLAKYPGAAAAVQAIQSTAREPNIQRRRAAARCSSSSAGTRYRYDRNRYSLNKLMDSRINGRYLLVFCFRQRRIACGQRTDRHRTGDRSAYRQILAVSRPRVAVFHRIFNQRLITVPDKPPCKRLQTPAVFEAMSCYLSGAIRKGSSGRISGGSHCISAPPKIVISARVHRME